MFDFIAPSIPYWLASGTMILRTLLGILALIVLWEVATLLAVLIGFVSDQVAFRPDASGKR
jgi:hypothetical protein